MSLSSPLSALLQRAVRDRLLSAADQTRLEAALADRRVDAREVETLLGPLVGQATDRFDAGAGSRQKSVHTLLARLDTAPAAVPVSAPGMRWIDALTAHRAPKPSRTHATALEETALPQADFRGRPMEVREQGQVWRDGAEVALDLRAPTPAAISALAGLLRPDQLTALTATERQDLTDRLLGALSAALPIAADAPGAYGRTVATTFAVGALARLAPHLSTAQVDALVALYGKLPNPMAQALALEGLQQASPNPAQAEAVARLAVPEHQEALAQMFHQMADGQGRIGFRRLEGAVAEVALAGLVFCKKPASWENLFQGIEAYGKIRPEAGFDDDEVRTLETTLAAYVEAHGALSYVFGTFASDAPRQVAKASNEALVARLTPALRATSPALDTLPLDPAQATVVQTWLPGLKDDAAAARLGDALRRAHRLFMGEHPTTEGETPPCPAAFALVQRTFEAHLQTCEGNADGMVDAQAFLRDLQKESSDIAAALTPRMQELRGTPPRFGAVELSQTVATRLIETLQRHTRSRMSVDNLGLCLDVIAANHNGKIDDAGAQQLDAILDQYMGYWPKLEVFDFNKLERIARFAVEGKALPLCTVNGKAVGLADFYGQVGAAVTASIDRASLRHEWQAHRYGFRAQEAAEWLDVVAELYARQEGPLASLAAQFPGRAVEVRATGLDGMHQQFLFVVQDGGRTRTFTQGSDGTLAPYQDRKEPVLFTATVREDGSFDVQIPEKNRARKYPLQTPYGVGDHIDVKVYDPQATEVREEGKTFDTQFKVVEGTITGFDALGNYTVSYRKPDGTEVSDTLSLTEISKANHPHYFSETGSYLRDVQIDIRDDQPLLAFLEGADPIIQRHLPTDGSLAGLSAAELAKRQRACVESLMQYTSSRMKYPSKSSTQANDKRYYELDGMHRFDLGELVQIERGVCRHQCIVHHLLLQRAGIDSRLASGAANTSSGAYRGLHLWVELTLADNRRYLSDQTWSDPLVPLWEGAYDADRRRIEIYNRTGDFDVYHPQ